MPTQAPGAISIAASKRTFDYDLWRAYDLKPGKHTLRIVTRDDADARSKGKNVILRRAIIYR
jgi:hypothetical protein